MKKLSFILLILVICITGYSQDELKAVRFSMYASEACFWNTRTEKFDECDVKYENSLFTMNKKVTQLKHETENQTSVYYLREYYPDEGGEDQMFWLAESDVGNWYYVMIDFSNSCIKFMPAEKNPEFAILWHWKTSWEIN